MRFTLSSTALGSQLLVLSKVINSKNSVAILGDFLFEVKNSQLTLTASDGENVMKTVLQLEESDGDGSFAVPYQTILDAVKELPEQPLSFEIDLEALTIKVLYQNGMYNFTAQSAEEYPQSKTIGDGATSITIDSGVLAESLSRSLFSTANDELRPVMNGIYFDQQADFLAIVATDGHSLVRNRIFSIKNDIPSNFILPKKPALILKNVLTQNGDDVVIRFDSSSAEVKYGDSILSCRLIEGKYPNYASVIPNDSPNKVTADRKALLGAIKRVLPFASDSSELIRFTLSDGCIELSSEDIDFATSAKEKLVCEYEGQPKSIGFKGSGLIDALNNLNSDDVEISLSDPSRPGIIVPVQEPEGQDVLMLVMPMLLND